MFETFLIKNAGENIKLELFRLVCDICETGELPKDFIKFKIIPVQKKADESDCEH